MRRAVLGAFIVRIDILLLDVLTFDNVKCIEYQFLRLVVRKIVCM